VLEETRREVAQRARAVRGSTTQPVSSSAVTHDASHHGH
jgi:hypothetical protein